MRIQPIYVVIGTVHDNNQEEKIIVQEFLECETSEQASEQAVALEKQLKFLYPNNKISAWINVF
jgi:hypothetical protein